MSVRADFDLDIAKFRAKLAAATSEVRKTSGQMKRESAGVGESFAGGFGKLNSVLGGLGLGVSMAGMGAAIKGVLNNADDIADLASALGESTEALQRVDHAAKITGAGGIDELSKAVIRLEKNLGDVENTAAADALARYGLNAAQLMAMPLDQKILALAAAFQKARADGTGVSDLMDLIGKSGANLLPMLTQNAEALKGLFDDAPLLKEADIQRLAEANDLLDTMFAKAKIGFAEVVNGLVIFGQGHAAMLSGKNPVTELANREQQANLAAQQRREAQQEAATGAAAAQAEASKAAAAKKAADEQAKHDKLSVSARERLEEARIAALPPGQRIAALEGKLGGLFSSKLAGTGVEGHGKAGLEQLIKDLDNPYDRSVQTGFIEALTEAEQIEREIAGLKKDQADLAEREMKERLASLKTGATSVGAAAVADTRRGGFQSLVDAIFGRAPNADLLDENRTQTGVLRSIDRKIDRLAQAPPPGDLFGYP